MLDIFRNITYVWVPIVSQLSVLAIGTTSAARGGSMSDKKNTVLF